MSTLPPRAGTDEAGERPLVALTIGDPAGIGPEIAVAATHDPSVRAAMRLLVLGPGSLCPPEIPREAGDERSDVAWVDCGGPSEWRRGEVQRECGLAAVRALRAGHERALEGRVRALVTGPVSKEALHLAGEEVEGQTELLGRWSGVARYEMVAVAGKLRVMLCTRHMPLARAIARISTELVADRLVLLDEFLRDVGIAAPRLALAGLNPHAGENGILGREEDEILRPALDRARARGIDVAGPVSPDTVFLRASQGGFDAVLALYHDQAFIPVKLLSQDRGVTVVAGLPYLRVSPVHGTAFDIAGKGIASPANLIAALLQAAEWSSSPRRTGDPSRAR